MTPEIVYIDARVRGLPVTQFILSQLSDVATEVIPDLRTLQAPAEMYQAKSRWVLTQAPKPLAHVVGHDDETLYLEADFVTNTPYECSYSPLPLHSEQRPFLTIFVNVESALAEIGQRAASLSSQQMVVRSGTYGDSLVLDHVTRFTASLIPFFAYTPNAQLELWTRSANIAHLLNLEHRGRTSVVFAVTPEPLIASEERGTALLYERLAAARCLADHGYPIVFSIDPIIQCDDWEILYDTLIDQLFTHVPTASLARIELSCLHYPRGLADQAGARFPDSRIFLGELVPVNGSYRYFRPVRQQMYDHLRESIYRRSEQLPVRIIQEHGILKAHA